MRLKRAATWFFFWIAAVNCRAPLVATGPLLPLIVRDLHLSATVGGTLTALPLLVMGASSIPAGVAVDRAGPRVVLILAQLGLAAFGGLRGLAPGPGVFLLAVAFLGGAIGISQPALARMAASIAPRATTATAVYANGFVIGAFLASVLSATVLVRWAGPTGWRGVMGMWALLGLGAGAGWLALPLPNPRRATARLQSGWWQALKLPGLWPYAIVFASQSAIFYGLATWLPTYYVQYGWSVAAASWPNTLMSLASIPGPWVATALARRWGGSRLPMLAFGALTFLGVVGFWLVPAWGLLWSTFPGLGTSGALTLGLAAPADLAPTERVGVVAGVLLAIGYLGAVPGALVVGGLRDLTGGFAAGLAYLAVIGVVFVAASWAVPRSAPREEAVGAP
ncbi:MAG: MFS transporter [Firmicutes bacterium]|nr:MFS transporter [Alicyclobacillaceae bacterium]MCL6496041.1 MFS transporter [Bacillota bacterium]